MKKILTLFVIILAGSLTGVNSYAQTESDKNPKEARVEKTPIFFIYCTEDRVPVIKWKTTDPKAVHLYVRKCIRFGGTPAIDVRN